MYPDVNLIPVRFPVLVDSLNTIIPRRREEKTEEATMASSDVPLHSEITKEQFASCLSQYPAVVEAISRSKGGTSLGSYITTVHLFQQQALFVLVCVEFGKADGHARMNSQGWTKDAL